MIGQLAGVLICVLVPILLFRDFVNRRNAKRRKGA